MRVNDFLATSATESRRLLDAAASTFGRRYEAEKKTVATSLCIEPGVSEGVDAEVLCTVHMRYLDSDGCGAGLRRVADRLMLHPDAHEVCVRVFNLRVPVKVPHERKTSDMTPHDWQEAVLSHVRNVRDSVLLDALKEPCFKYGARSCALLPDGYQDFHATVMSSWVRSVVKSVTIHQIFPCPGSRHDIAVWNATRVSWSLNSATWRLRPCSYLEWLWTEIDRVQASDSGMVQDTTVDMIMSSNEAVAHTLVPVADPVAQLVDVVEQAAFRVTRKFPALSFASCAQRDDRASEQVVKLLKCLPAILQDAAESSTFNIPCTATSTDLIIAEIEQVLKAIEEPEEFVMLAWLNGMRRAVLRSTVETMTDSVHTELVKDSGFFIQGGDVLEDLREHIASLFYVWTRVWRVLWEFISEEKTDGRDAETTMWATRLFECVCESSDDWYDLLTISHIADVWRRVVCRVYPHQASQRARAYPMHKWMDYAHLHTDSKEEDLSDDSFAGELSEAGANRAVKLLSQTVAEACSRLYFNALAIRRVVLEEWEFLNGAQFPEGRLWRRMLVYLLQTVPLSRLVANVIINAQLEHDDPRVLHKALPFEVLNGTWRYTGFSNCHLVAAVVTRKALSAFANQLATGLVLKSLLRRVYMHVADAVKWMGDMNMAQKLNACALVKQHYESHDGNDFWDRWSADYSINFPPWLFSALGRHGAPPITPIREQSELIAYRCALCLCLCYSHAYHNSERTSAVGFDQQFLYCGGAQCRFYGVVCPALSVLACVKLGAAKLQQTVQLRWEPPVDQPEVASLKPVHRPLEHFTRLSSLCHVGTYENTMVPRTNCYTGFYNVFVCGHSFVAPGMLLARDRLDSYDALVAADHMRLQDTAARHLVFGDSTDHRPNDTANSMFTRMGVAAPQGTAVSRETLRQHGWWHRLHVYPPAKLCADAKEDARVDYLIERMQSDDTKDKLQGVLASRVIRKVAREYVLRLGAPWLSTLCDTTERDVPLALLETYAHSTYYIAVQTTPLASSCDPECMYLMFADETKARTQPVLVETARTVDTLRTVGAGTVETADLMTTHSMSTRVGTEVPAALHDYVSDDDEPSRVSTAGTYEDWGDSDLYESGSSASASADAAAKAKATADGAPELIRVHGLDRVENTHTEYADSSGASDSSDSSAASTSRTTRLEPNQMALSELISDMQNTQYRAKQLQGRLKAFYSQRLI